MRKIKVDVKDVVLPHSQAKLDLYKNYLEHYLRVLSLTPHVDEIYIYDAFCGSGEYSDGNYGSPILTNQTIAKINTELTQLAKQTKKINFIINDIDTEKIENVKKILIPNKQPNCNYFSSSLDANQFLDEIATSILRHSSRCRNLIFIDPYGYSNITKEKIYNLVKNEYSEVLLFLPVMQMYRFKGIAINSPERKCYEALRNFIFSFFPENHKIHNDGINSIFEFINAIKLALSYDSKFYTCSHYIEREKGNYYSLFFITSNIYGLQKMVESKWKLDPNQGKGFNQPSIQQGLFDEQFLEIDNSHNISNLKQLIRDFLINNKTINNCQLYFLGVINEFQPSQVNKAVSDLLSNRVIKQYNSETNPVAKYINYTHFNNNEIKVTFELRIK